MSTFDCLGRITVALSESMADKHADITVSHSQDHVPYCYISLPTNVQEIVKTSPDKDPTQIWQEVLKRYPKPQFSCDSVYQMWHNREKAKWKSDVDEVTSARNLLKKGLKSGGLGEYAFECVEIEEPEGMSVIAFSLPEMVKRWCDRIWEIALDSAWGTNHAGYEVFTILGEAYGSGLPLGYLLLKAIGDLAEGSKRRVLEEFLKHFRDRWRLVVKVTLSDKDWSEIGACQRIFPDAKHQLCFWHCLRAVRKRLAILHRQPGPYNVAEAVMEFPFIDPTFLPLAQQPTSTP
ncbi:hypothetical protein M407DRAFT_47609, partial [Tulasnella calospora MUT 4182]